MALRLYENLRNMEFDIHMGTGKPPVHVNGTPRVWLDDSVADRYPQWFSRTAIPKVETTIVDDSAAIPTVEETVAEPKTPDVEASMAEIDDETPTAQLIDVDDVMGQAEKIHTKEKLDEFGLLFGVELDRREKLETMRVNLRAELEKMNEDA